MQKTYKERFIREELIPVLQRLRLAGGRCFFHRTVENGPVILVYAHTDDVRAGMLYSQLTSRLNKYCEQYFNLFEENPLYAAQSSNIRIMNRLARSSKEYTNYTIRMESMSRIERYGEYYSTEAKEAVNEWLLDHGALLEKSCLVLQDRPEIARQTFLVYLFLLCSERLEKQTYRGYLSFKSHYLGFMNLRKAEMSSYALKFEDYYRKYGERFVEIKRSRESGKTILSELPGSEELAAQWGQAIELFMNSQQGLTKSVRLSNVFSMIQFRRYSSFHKESFKWTTLGYYFSPAFQEYRLLINMIYLILPDLGFNTVKRLQASHALVRMIEEGVELNELGV